MEPSIMHTPTSNARQVSPATNHEPPATKLVYNHYPSARTMNTSLTSILPLSFIVASAFAQPAHDAALKNLKFRSIGPAIIGGRIDDFAVVESDPRVIYVATASAGILK